MNKTCHRCQSEKPLEEFTRNKSCSSGYTNQCKKCKLAYDLARAKIRRKTDPEWLEKDRARKRKIYDRNRVVWLSAKYNITPDDYEKMVKRCGGKCEICGRPGNERPRKNNLCVDHDHLTGKVRGILCWICNTSLGGFDDNPDNLTKAIEYLKR